MRKITNRQMKSGRDLWVCCVLMLVVTTVGAHGGGNDVALEGEHGGLRLTVRLTGLVGWNDGMAAAIGREMRYEARVRNVSKEVLRIPAPDKRLYVALTRPGTLSSRHAGSRADAVQVLEPGKELELSGELTLLQTNVCQLIVSFSNSQTQQQKRVVISHIEPGAKFGTLGPTTRMVPVTNVWTGRIGLSTTLNTTGRLDYTLRTRYGITMRKVLAFEQAVQPMTNYNPNASGKLFLEQPNLTQQSEAVSAIRQIGSDANSKSVAWLWECFGKTQKNSPLHVAAMAELYQLLGQGIGSEHAERFLAVANADSTEEAIVTRLYAMDAAALYCTRREFVCVTKGNYLITPVAPGLPEKARKTLEALTSEPLKDIHARAKELLGVHEPRESRGVRKHVRSRGEPEDARKEKAVISWPLLSVSGIVGKGQNGAAVINNQIVQIGDSILGVKVLSVDPVLKGVSLEYGSEVRLIEVGKTAAGP